jgi:hypothetical protein
LLALVDAGAIDIVIIAKLTGLPDRLRTSPNCSSGSSVTASRWSVSRIRSTPA